MRFSIRAWGLFGVALGTALPVLRAQVAPSPLPSVAEQYLFQAANAERIERGIQPLRWDGTLYQAAELHATAMAARESISHQYPGEEDLAERAQDAGAHFSVVAENVAEAPTAVMIHRAWMESPDHRENLLDPRVDRVAISVLRRDGQLYAVEDFDRSVAALSFMQQESAVAGMIAQASSIAVQIADEGARRTCEQGSGYAGARRPWFVMRFTTGELDALPSQLRARLASGRFRQATVGACAAKDTEHFSGYSLAVLLFP